MITRLHFLCPKSQHDILHQNPSNLTVSCFLNHRECTQCNPYSDGSMWCGDMAIQNVIGDALRGATWVSIHNGGGVGWGEVRTHNSREAPNSALF